MAGQLNLPNALQSQLTPTSKDNTFKIKSWLTWFNQGPARVGMVTLVAGDRKKFTTRVLGVHTSQSGITTLIVEPLFPDPPIDFMSKQPMVIFSMGFVEGGFAVITRLHANAQRDVMIKEIAGIQLDDIYNPTATVSVHSLELPNRHKVILRFKLAGSDYEISPDEVSTLAVKFKAKLKANIGESGVKVENATLRLTENESPIPLKLELFPAKDLNYEARIRAINPDNHKRLVEFIDKTWHAKAVTQHKRRISARKRAIDDMKGGYLKTLDKTHFFLLSESESWENLLAEIGVVRRMDDVDIDYVTGEMKSDRCDVIFADAGLWDKVAVDLSNELKESDELQKTPLFWMSGGDVALTDKRRLSLINLGAYGFIKNGMSSKALGVQVGWALRAKEIGEGQAITIISNNARRIYRLGTPLAEAGFKVIKCTSMKNPLVALNKDKPRMVLVDAPGIGKGYDTILTACLSWAKKGAGKNEVLLIAEPVDSDQMKRWSEAGLVDVLPPRTPRKQIAEKVRSYINR